MLCSDKQILVAENTVGPWKFFGRGRVEPNLALIAYTSIPYKGSDLLAADHPQQITWLVHIEDDDGQLILHAQGKGGHIHDLKVLADAFLEGDGLEFLRRGIFFGVCGIDAVHACALENDFRVDLDGAEGARGVGGEIRVPGSRAKDDDTAFLDVPDRPAPDIGFRYLFHLYRALQAGIDAYLLQAGLHGHSIDDGGKHAHIVSMCPFDAGLGFIHAPVDIAAADDDGDLYAEFRDTFDIPGVLSDDRIVESKAFVSHQGLTG